MSAVKDGKYIDVHCLIMTLPYSNAGFAVPLPSENQECFLHGLEKIFYQVGGVPRTIRMDNLKAAVIKPRSVTHSRYSAYLPGRIREYLKIDDLKARKERIGWLLSLIVTYEMQEINERFYELADDTDIENKIDTLHPYGVDWSKYDQLHTALGGGNYE